VIVNALIGAFVASDVWPWVVLAMHWP
jgi:hypothetical protein